MSNPSLETNAAVQNYEKPLNSRDDANETCSYFCESCQKEVILRRCDVPMCPHPSRTNPAEICYRMDLIKTPRKGWYFRVCR